MGVNLVDIVVTTKNNCKSLYFLLDSIRNQDFSDYNCWVVGDNSTDGTRDMVKKEFPWVNLITVSKTGGPAGNRNLAIRRGNAPFIVTLDDDVLLEFNWLSRMLKCICFSKRIGIVGSQLRFISSPDKINSAGGCFGEGGFAGDILFDKSVKEFELLFNFPYYRVLFVCSAAMIMRREAYKESGGFDSSYFYFAEDYDLALRINLLGYLVLTNKEAVAHHGYQHTVKQFSPRHLRYLNYRNQLKTILKAFSLEGLSQILIRFSLAMGRDFYFSLLIKNYHDSWVIVKSTIWNFLHFLEILRQRRYIRSRRKIDDDEIFSLNAHLLSLSKYPSLRSLATKDLSLKEKLGVLPLKVSFRLLRRKRKIRSNYVDHLILWVTSLCDASCPMCFLKDRLNKDIQNNLSHEEYKKIFHSLGRIRENITLGGGEPFLRKDVVEICLSADSISKPAIITIPTNGNNPEIIFEKVKSILDSINARLLISLSLDGLPETHERIRGVQGIYARLEQTYDKLITLREIFYPRLQLQINTVLFKDNYYEFPKVYELLKKRFVNARFSFEVIRGNYDTSLVEPITEEQYRHFLGYIKSQCDPRIEWQIPLHELSLKVLERKTQIVPCVAGFKFIVIDFLGNLYPCEILPFLLNLRDIGYDIGRVFNDIRWQRVIQNIRESKCFCTHMCFLGASLK